MLHSIPLPLSPPFFSLFLSQTILFTVDEDVLVSIASNDSYYLTNHTNTLHSNKGRVGGGGGREEEEEERRPSTSTNQVIINTYY